MAKKPKKSRRIYTENEILVRTSRQQLGRAVMLVRRITSTMVDQGLDAEQAAAIREQFVGGVRSMVGSPDLRSVRCVRWSVGTRTRSIEYAEKALHGARYTLTHAGASIASLVSHGVRECLDALETLKKLVPQYGDGDVVPIPGRQYSLLDRLPVDLVAILRRGNPHTIAYRTREPGGWAIAYTGANERHANRVFNDLNTTNEREPVPYFELCRYAYGDIVKTVKAVRTTEATHAA